MSDTDSRAGSNFGHYRLIRLLGRGGMGEVYEAEDTRKDRTVALKVLPAAMSNDPVFRKRLQREAHSAGRLQEPHVVPIHDYGEIDGVLYVDMRFIDGTDLRRILSRYGPLTPARAVAIIRQIASALDAAHASGLVHRDIKPENVLITGDDFAYLVDFGIANAATDEKLTELGSAVGTYAYMSPERFSNAEVTYKADIYALACVLHECLTGGTPFPTDSVSVAITAHLMNPVPRPSAERPGIPPGFDQVVARGMAKDPKDRYASTGDLAKAAHDALATRDQDKADTILARSQAATMHGFVTPPPSSTPPSTPASFSTPPPSAPTAMAPQSVAASSQPPYQPPGPAGPGWSGPGGYGGPPSGGPPSGGPPPWQPPSSGPMPSSSEPPKRNWVPIIAAIVAVVLLVGGGVVAAVLLTKDDESSSATGTDTSTSMSTSKTTTTRSKTRTTTTRPTTTGETGASARLMDMLPTGYDSGTCKPLDQPYTGALATIECGKNSNPGGPDVGYYSLFPDKQALDQLFDAAIKVEGEELQACPGFDTSPTDWFYESTPDKVEGQVACAMYKGTPDIIWTRNADLMLAEAQGPDMATLHDWWLKFG